MVNNKYLALFFLPLFLFILSGCKDIGEKERTPAYSVTFPNPSPQVKVTLTPSNIPIMIITPTPMPAILPSLTKKPTSVPLTWTPLPPFSPEKATEVSNQVKELMRDTTACRLPCWWGIKPGETDWKKTSHILSPLSKENVYIYDSKDSQTFSAGFTIYSDEDEIGPTLIIQDEVVDFIEINFGSYTYLTLFDFVALYGPPDEVMIGTYNRDIQGQLPFDLLIGYFDKGILAYFQGGNEAKVKGGSIQQCFLGQSVFVLDLWSPESEYNLEQIADKGNMFTYRLGNDLFLPLEETSSMNIEYFVKQLSQPGKTLCIETPAKFWRSPFE